MSIAALKTLLFGRPKPCPRLLQDSPNGYGTLGGHSKRCSRRTSSSSPDLESQQPTTPINPKCDCPADASSPKINARIISDATIGLSDGLTVPFALTAGLSALGNTRVVIFGGLAELIAGAISMGLGGYLGAKSEIASYHETRLQTASLICRDPTAAEKSIQTVFSPFGVPAHLLKELTHHISASGPDHMVDFITKFEHCAEEPSSSRALTSALTIALAYFLGGLVPLLPYLCVGANQVLLGLYISIAVMAVALFSFGYVKTCIVVGWEGSRCVKKGLFGGVQMVVVGGAAAGAAMGLVKAFDGMGGS